MSIIRTTAYSSRSLIVLVEEMTIVQASLRLFISIKVASLTSIFIAIYCAVIAKKL